MVKQNIFVQLRVSFGTLVMTCHVMVPYKLSYYYYYFLFLLLLLLCTILVFFDTKRYGNILK